jgi:hypothetical protein
VTPRKTFARKREEREGVPGGPAHEAVHAARSLDHLGQRDSTPFAQRELSERGPTSMDTEPWLTFPTRSGAWVAGGGGCTALCSSESPRGDGTSEGRLFNTSAQTRVVEQEHRSGKAA